MQFILSDLSIKIHTPTATLFPYTTLFRSPLWTYASEHGLPVLMHMGTTFISQAPLEYARPALADRVARSEEHTSELQSRGHLVCRLLLEKKNIKIDRMTDRQDQQEKLIQV